MLLTHIVTVTGFTDLSVTVGLYLYCISHAVVPSMII